MRKRFHTAHQRGRALFLIAKAKVTPHIFAQTVVKEGNISTVTHWTDDPAKARRFRSTTAAQSAARRSGCVVVVDHFKPANAS